ncbi:reverse transcriptase domain-containing protein [Artemisia annua]|uniref:Reverse transcriptase domain-containing protein n=1 Tax=Artemisia annua TaxID=35608 RepID=A0A2U1NKV7_ARTAN|nr:reverse transcriptase domain-containing protein [Artemisia annua]
MDGISCERDSELTHELTKHKCLYSKGFIQVEGTDISKTDSKSQKPDKNEHENGKCQKPKPGKSKSQSQAQKKVKYAYPKIGILEYNLPCEASFGSFSRINKNISLSSSFKPLFLSSKLPYLLITSPATQFSNQINKGLSSFLVKFLVRFLGQNIAKLGAYVCLDYMIYLFNCLIVFYLLIISVILIVITFTIFTTRFTIRKSRFHLTFVRTRPGLGSRRVHDRLGRQRSPSESPSRLGSRRVYDRLRRQRSPSESPSRLGGRRVHDRLGRQRSPSGSPSSSDSEDSRRKRRRSVSLSSNDSSDNEDEETGHWKSRKRYRDREDEDMSRPWRRQKVDAFTRRISDFSEDKRRRMPANVKTYDGTGDPDDHLKIFESAATIENWPQPVWCHMFNSTLVGNAWNWFSKLPRRSIDGFEELRKAFRLNFTQRKKCAKNPVELARVKQRQGESTSAYVERYKDECIHVKACPEILKISGFMNGINNPELIKKLNDRVPQTFDELMKSTRSFIQGEAAAADSKKGYSNYKSQEQPRRQSNDQSSNRNKSYRSQGGGRENDKRRELPETTTNVHPEDRRVGNGYCEYHGQKGHTTNECVQLRQLIDKLVKEGRLDHLVKNIKEGKDKQKAGSKKEAPKDKAETIYMIQSWERKTRQKVSQKFSYGSEISFPTLAADNAVVEPLTIEINAGGHDIHRMYVDGGASTDIMYEHCFKKLRPEIQSQLSPVVTPLTGFTGEKIWPMGQIRLLVVVGNREHSTTAWMNFMVIKSPSPYNGIIGRPGISAIRAVPSASMPVEGVIVTLYNNAVPPGECNAITCETTHTPEQRSVRQKKRDQAPERAKAILDEVHKLVDAVMVKKNDGSWRMCVDFTDLNKACPQDCYPLPEIDWKVESLCGYPLKCFLDAFKGYHQIQMAKEDEEKTAFHTSQGVYCYTKMPFGLKNAGATYQRLVYVDDLVIKSHTEDELVRDIEETFKRLGKINMKLNPKKCIFGATEGMFLGYLIEPDGIKPCPEKTQAVIQLPSPRTLKEVQSLNGKLAGLNRFLSKSADKSLPLFKTLKKCTKKGDFRWTTEAEEAFTQLKQHIAALPTLVAPQPGEELIMYLSATHGAVSAVLLTDRNSVQTPVYFVSKALKKTEVNYSAMEKLVLALVFAAKRLRRYFQAHPIAVITDQPIKQVIFKPDASGRLQKWSVLLGEHNISYRPRTAVKGQVLFTDGSSCVDGSGAGLILTNPEGMEFTYALRFEFTATNNEAEYEALIAGLRIATRMGVRNLESNVDSRLVANHLSSEYVAKEDNMIQYLDKTKSLIQGFDRFTIKQVPRGENKKADALSKIASTSFAHLSKQVLVEILKNKSILEMEVSTVIEEQDPTWMTPIIEFISKGILP